MDISITITSIIARFLSSTISTPLHYMLDFICSHRGAILIYALLNAICTKYIRVQPEYCTHDGQNVLPNSFSDIYSRLCFLSINHR